MSTATTPASTSPKIQRELMGQLGSPIPAVQVYSKPMGDHFGGREGISWIVITPEKTVINASTFDGKLGRNFNLGEHNTRVLPVAEKDVKKMVKGYSEVLDASTLPAFITLA